MAQSQHKTFGLTPHLQSFTTTGQACPVIDLCSKVRMGISSPLIGGGKITIHHIKGWVVLGSTVNMVRVFGFSRRNAPIEMGFVDKVLTILTIKNT